MIRIPRLHIMPGYLCNYTCSHCVNDSGPSNDSKLSSEEEHYLNHEIKRFAPMEMVFTGGEPFLYINEINRIIDMHPIIEDTRIQITTNGFFATYEKKQIKEKLSSIKKISKVLLSYDIYRTKKLTTNDIENFAVACAELKLEFQVSVCIKEPKEILYAHELAKRGISIVYQKIESSGRAKNNHLEYQYPIFGPKVLETKCPNLESPSFISGKCFSICCSNLIFNSTDHSKYCHKTLDEHYTSPFYRAMSELNFKKLAKEVGVDTSTLAPKFSAACTQCEFIHERKKSSVIA